MSSTLNDAKNNEEAIENQNSFKVETDLIESVLRSGKVISDDEYKKLKRYDTDGLYANETKARKGNILMNHNQFKSKGHTSKYGTQSPAEFFAEAFHGKMFIRCHMYLLSCGSRAE